MKKILVIAGIVVAATFGVSAAALAQGKGANPPMTKAVDETGEEGSEGLENEGLESFARADKAADDMQGFKERNTRGANKQACPPGQKKKTGAGIRSRC